MQRLIVGFAAAIFLSSCATGSPTEGGRAPAGAFETSGSLETLADGTEAWMIECVGLMNSWNNCWDRANSLCPDGYALLGQNEIPKDGMTSVEPFRGTGVNKFIYVKCK